MSFILESGTMICKMAKENKNACQGNFHTMVNGKMVKKKEKGFEFGQGENMMVNGKMVNLKEKVLKFTQPVGMIVSIEMV